MCIYLNTGRPKNLRFSRKTKHWFIDCNIWGHQVPQIQRIHFKDQKCMDQMENQILTRLCLSKFHKKFQFRQVLKVLFRDGLLYSFMKTFPRKNLSCSIFLITSFSRISGRKVLVCKFDAKVIQLLDTIPTFECTALLS